MSSTQKERENFYRISTIIVDHGKEALTLLLDNELDSNNQTVVDFINLNQHAIYHLCYNKRTCCQCMNGKLPLTTSANRVLYPDQLEILLDKSGQTLSCHNKKSSSQFCCCLSKATLTTKHLDLTLLRCLLINFASISCPPNSSIRLAVDALIGFRNKLYGHAQEARYSDTDYILYKSQIKNVILTIARSCKQENEMKQTLKDTAIRPFDETICQQYQNCLLYDIQRNEDIKAEIKCLRKQSELNNYEIVQCILKTDNKITTNISSHNKTITDQIEGLQLKFAKRDEILYERIQSMEVKVNVEVSKQTKDIMMTIETEKEDRRVKHAELIGHIQQTDERKQNLIDHSNALIQCHLEDETFVCTNALEKGKNILKNDNLLILLAKGGSGKTQIARHLASVYKDEGYIPLFFSDKDVIKYRDLISLTEKQVVVIEDLFGRMNVDFYEDIHRNILDILSNCLKTSLHLKMIFTIRNDPKCEENILAKHDIFHKKDILNLDYESRISDKERITILLSHMRYNSIISCRSPLKVHVDVSFDYQHLIPCCLSECTADVMKLPCGKISICTDIIYKCCMCDTFLGFPETCRMFCCDKSLTFLGVTYFRNTNESLVNTVNNLFSESFEKLSCRYQYSVLVYTALKYNFFDNNVLGSNIEKDELFKEIFSIFDEKGTNIRKTLVQQAIRKLEGGYLIKSLQYSEFNLDCSVRPRENAYMIKHQALHDAVLVSFGNECPDILLDMDICDLGFLLNYIRPSLKQPDPNSSVIHVNPTLVLDKLFLFLDKDISLQTLQNDKIKDVSRERRRFDEHDLRVTVFTIEVNKSPHSQTKETVSDKSTDNVYTYVYVQSISIGSNNRYFEDEIEDDGEFSEFPSRFVRGYSEMIGEYIRKCIIEEKDVPFIKTFLERLSKLSPRPQGQITKFLNGLTRRGTCLMNLAINSDIIRDFAFNYADINVLCLLFRPESSNIKLCKFYKLDDKSLQDKLFTIIDGNIRYKNITEIGKFLYRIGVQEGNYEFVNRFLNKILDEYQNRDNLYKIRYIIDGMSNKGKNTDIVSHFKEFTQKYILIYGSIKAIIGLWEVLSTETFQSSQPLTNQPLMVVLEDKFKNHILFGRDIEHGVNTIIQTEEYGACVFNLGLKMQDNKCIEELIFKLFEIYKTSLQVSYLVTPASNIEFLLYFYRGFISSNFQPRRDEAFKMCPLGMEKLISHVGRFWAFFGTVGKLMRNRSVRDNYRTYLLHKVRNIHIIDPNFNYRNVNILFD